MSLFPLNTVLFPREQFGSKQTALHHYIAHRNKANFDTWLGKVEDKFPELLDARDPKYGLTPLAVAVMAKDLAKAKALHAAGASLETRDCRRWTLLHYAELQNDEAMASWLRTQCVALECMRNAAGLTPLGLRARTLIPCSTDNQEVFSYKDSDQTVKAGTGAKFYELTHAHFSPHILITPKGMAAEWIDVIGQKETVANRVLIPLFTRAYKEAFERFLASPPQLFLSHSPTTGYGLHAGEAISTGEVITYYGGVIDGEDKRASGGNPYLWMNQVDGCSVRNLGPMANDSTPNAEIVELANSAGLPVCPVFIALVPIGANEQIVVDYGPCHPAKLHHCELRQEALETYFRQHALSDVAQLASNPDLSTVIQRSLPQAMYKYLFSTPSALLHLLLKQIVTHSQIVYCVTSCLDVRAEGVDVFYKLNSREVLLQFAQLVQPHLSREAITALLSLNQEAPFIASLMVMMCLVMLTRTQSALENRQIVSMISPIKTMGVAVHKICEEGRKGRFNREAWAHYMQASKQLPEASLPFFMFFMKDSILDKQGLTQQFNAFIRQVSK